MILFYQMLEKELNKKSDKPINFVDGPKVSNKNNQLLEAKLNLNQAMTERTRKNAKDMGKML